MIDIKVKKELIKNFKIIKDNYLNENIQCGTVIDLKLFNEWRNDNIEEALKNFYEWSFWKDYLKKEISEYSYLDDNPYIQLIKYKISSGDVYLFLEAGFGNDENISEIKVRG
jgi:hypothetical protein